MSALRRDRRGPSAETCYNGTVRVVGKVCACVVREGAEGLELLAFDHPVAGTQLPKGTLEPGEDPLDGVLRELSEETGLSSVDVVRRIGKWVRMTGAGPEENGDTERHDWEIFLLRPRDELSSSWTHVASGSTAEVGKEFRCRWLSLDDAVGGKLHPLFSQVIVMLRQAVGGPP